MSSAITTVRAKSVSRPLFGCRATRRAALAQPERERAAPGPAPAAGGQGARAEEAIIFYEGLRPIRCKKIRYFQDGRFERGSCRRPIVAPALRRDAGDRRRPATEAQPVIPARRRRPRQVTREATAEDIERLELADARGFRGAPQ